MQKNMEPEPEKNRHQLTVPLAIVIAGLLVAGAIFFSRGATEPVSAPTAAATTEKIAPAARGMRAVDATDHIRGNPDAALLIVEFSDLECPFCRDFHPTMLRIMEEYGKSGKVSWVYRHFPLAQIHPKAQKEAEATECAAELGGNAKFWEYTDRVFEITPSNNNLDRAELPAIAERVGLDRKAFEACLASGRHAARVARDYDDGLASGIDGTPFSVMVAKDGGKTVVRGAQSYAVLKQTIDEMLK